MLRPFSILILFLLFNFEFPQAQSSRESSPLYEIPQLSARAIGIGMAMTAVSSDEQSIFHNPAGLAGVRLFRVGQSHSLRHFPGEIKNLDQLDADPVAIVHPLPIGGVFANGFVLQGECGYDYLNRNENDYPERKVWGIERYDAYAANVTPWTKIGFAHRSNLYREKTSLTPRPPLHKDVERGGKSGDDNGLTLLSLNTQTPFYRDINKNDGINDILPLSMYMERGSGGEASGISWQKEGEGGCFGIIQTILPGVNYGYSSSKFDEDYIPETGVTTKSVHHGWSFKPLPWIHIALDNETIKTKTRLSGDIITGKSRRRNWGIEITPLPGITIRHGSANGHRTNGLTLGFGPLKLNYGEAKDLMPMIVGKDYPDRFKDLHLAGWVVEVK